MRLLLDMDGPLADFDRHFYEVAVAEGVTFDIAGPHEQTHRFFTEHIPNRRERAAMRAKCDAPGWFESLPPTPGAITGARRLIEAGIDVWVCTKPLEVNPTCRDAKGAWLHRWLPELEHKLIITPDKSLIRGYILLDDAPHPDWIPVAEWRPVIFAAPYNGIGSPWAALGRWTWGDSIADLINAAFYPLGERVGG